MIPTRRQNDSNIPKLTHKVRASRKQEVLEDRDRPTFTDQVESNPPASSR